MDSRQDPIWKNSMNYGAIVGFSLVIYNVILYLFSYTFSNAFGIINYIIIIGGIVMGTTTLRENEFEGTISYGKALASGTLICLFSAIIFAFYNYILYAFIDPDLMEKSFAFQQERYISRGKLSIEEIEIRMELVRKLSTPFNVSILSIPMFTFLGFMLSLVTSVFLKSDKSQFDINE